MEIFADTLEFPPRSQAFNVFIVSQYTPRGFSEFWPGLSGATIGIVAHETDHYVAFCSSVEVKFHYFDLDPSAPKPIPPFLRWTFCP